MVRIKRVNENLDGEVCKVLNLSETENIYDKNPIFELDFTDEENKIIDEQYKKILTNSFDIFSKEGECHEIDPSYEVAYKVTSKYYFTELDIVAVKLPDDYYFVHVFTGIFNPSKKIKYVDINLLCDDIDGLEEIAQTIIKEIKKEYGR